MSSKQASVVKADAIKNAESPPRDAALSPTLISCEDGTATNAVRYSPTPCAIFSAAKSDQHSKIVSTDRFAEPFPRSRTTVWLYTSAMAVKPTLTDATIETSAAMQL